MSKNGISFHVSDYDKIRTNERGSIGAGESTTQFSVKWPKFRVNLITKFDKRNFPDPIKFGSVLMMLLLLYAEEFFDYFKDLFV